MPKEDTKPTATGTKKSSKKSAVKSDAPKQKKAPSPYIIYCLENRDKLKTANPDATFGALGRLLGEGWRKLSDVQKKVKPDICLLSMLDRKCFFFNYPAICRQE